MLRTIGLTLALVGVCLLAPHPVAAQTASASPAVAQALEDFRHTAILYRLKYEFRQEALTGAAPDQLALYPFATAWPAMLAPVVRSPQAYRIVGANGEGYTDSGASGGFAFPAPLTRGLTPERSLSLLFLAGIDKQGGIVATDTTSVYVKGDMAGLLNYQSYSTTVIRGDLSGTLHSDSYANIAVYGKTRGRITLNSSANLYLLGGLTGELYLNQTARVFIGGTTPDAVLKHIHGDGKVSLQASDLKPGDYTRGSTQITVLGGSNPVSATASPSDTDVKPAVPRHLRPFEEVADVADVPQQDLRAGNNPDMRYALIGPLPGDKMPKGGYKLLLVLPGGDGSPDFNPFLRRVAKNALPPGYVVAELVAPVWNPKQAQAIVWPTTTSAVPDAKFTTEQFVRAVIKDVQSKQKVNPRAVFALGWSSGGPPVYASLLEANSPLSGAFVAMSIFPASALPLANAKGKAVYLLHSPQDFIKISQAESARDRLAEQGAKTTLTTYKGGHGWQEDPFGHIQKGVEWLEANTTANP